MAEYRMNGAAAYDIYAQQDQTARPLERPDGLPEAPARREPVRKVKTRLAISPLAMLGTALALVMLFLVVFSYVRLYEAQSEVGELQSQKDTLGEQQERLRLQYESSLDLEAIEKRALELGLRQPSASQNVYVKIVTDDTTELFEAQEEQGLFAQVYDAFCGVLHDVVEYFS